MSNTKIIAIIAVAIVAVVAVAAFALSSGGGGGGGGGGDTITVVDNNGRTVTLDTVPEKVAVVNTDIMYALQILGVEDAIVGMDSDGRDKIPSSTDRIKQSDVVDLGKRSAFSGSTSIEKMKGAGIEVVLTPTTMGIGTTVQADAITAKGIKVVYVDMFGSRMLDNLDILVKVFGSTSDIKANANEFKDYFNGFIEEAKTIKPTPDTGQRFVYYMASSSGSVGNYYYSSSELNTIVTYISGYNRAQQSSGSFGQYTGEALFALLHDTLVPATDIVFMRGTDGYTVDQIKAVFDSQVMSGTTMGDFVEDNSVPVYYLNTHVVSGAMCCISYLIYAYVFTDTLTDENIAHLEKETEDFLEKYGFKFPVDDDHPLVEKLVYRRDTNGGAEGGTGGAHIRAHQPRRSGGALRHLEEEKDTLHPRNRSSHRSYGRCGAFPRPHRHPFLRYSENYSELHCPCFR